ncbi:hypothetical protein WDU94_009310 [Cyamophila willieti]
MVVPIHNCLFTINDALLYAPVLVQAYGWKDDPQVKIIPFPCENKVHPIVAKLGQEIDLVHNCGYVTLLKCSSEETKLKFELNAPSSSSVESRTFEKPQKSTTQEPILSNGTLSEENATLLREEIDSCDSKDNFRPKQVQDDGWVLIECCFGVPLFDHAMNKHICEAIVKQNLWGKESLEKLTKSNEILSNRLTHFINEFQDFNLKTSLCNKMKQEREISSWPMRTFMFHEGKVRDWNGK